MMRRTTALVAVGVLWLAACDKKETPAPVTETAPVTPPAAPVLPAATAPTEPAVDVASLPVEEQYEADAEKEVTAENLTAKLDELEKEISEP
ncbi:MAG: hypothetical protein K0R38_4180 [Polyangiaceae bacterium]|jgi:hypothetical protein|nr:hypothetical protein [Polyangiaceae bacterium]